jgi:DNA segregation ATPase FtsK/SpoIIIE-like protein
MGRAAGIFLVMATQYPSNASVPNHLREQFSRIGFKVKDLAASRLVLEDSGLEKIVERGVGIARIRGEMTPFRGFLLQPGGPGTPADHDFILSHLPKKPDGSVLDAEGAFHPPDPVPVPPPGIWAS